ncbi:MAG TPA: M23 family metallopeptidase [Vicinamibacterales bacterium]|jgi:murein DD-endopeptidase MepM/ murein hydrolase activator NlpD|nr:M23 family metallopeptidase [Vicinamibacterales bacterium]
MTGRRRSRGRNVVALFACFCGGVIVGWYLHAGAPAPAKGPVSAVSGFSRIGPPASVVSGVSRTTPAASGSRTQDAIAATGANNLPAVDALRAHDLRVPIDGVTVESMRGSFDERRDAGGRPHEAVDMLAPRNTPVHAVEDGTIAKLFLSKEGGNTIYQYDPTGRFCYYYAHLERYAKTVREGEPITRGDVIGFVGTSGNAPANTPHLHFAIFELTPERHWWQGTPIDPYLVFRR